VLPAWALYCNSSGYKFAIQAAEAQAYLASKPRHQFLIPSFDFSDPRKSGMAPNTEAGKDE